VEYKRCTIAEFIFKNSSLVSIYGTSGSGKTLIGLQVLKEFESSVFISTEGSAYKSRVRGSFKNAYFADAMSELELLNAIFKAISLEPKVLVVDTINKFFRMSRRPEDLLHPLILLKRFSKYGKVLIIWEVSMNNKVSGEKLMRYFSGDVLRVTKSYVIGNLRKCKFRITDEGVVGCLE